jgi:hypothetical protein
MRLINNASRISKRRLPSHATEQAAQSSLLRCIFGNPFRPIVLDPTWLTEKVVKQAEVAYEERELPSERLDFTRLAILADALEDAGCSEPDVLAHCRGSDPHVRGCWVADLVVGKH